MCSGVFRDASPVKKAAPTRKRSRIENSDSEGEEVNKVAERSVDDSVEETAAKVAKHESSVDSQLVGDPVAGVKGRSVAEVLRTPPKRQTARKHTGRVKTASSSAASSVSSGKYWEENIASPQIGCYCTHSILVVQYSVVCYMSDYVYMQLYSVGGGELSLCT